MLAAIVERHGRFLLTRRLKGTHLADLWEFPGGKCEAGETHEACLQRELLEELAAISGADGSFKLDNVPAGSYDIRVWHEALKAAVPTRVVVKDGETVTLNVTMK